MTFEPTLSQQDWLRLRRLAAAGVFSFKVGLVDKIKGDRTRRWTEDAALEIHRVTNGEIPCWSVRPDLWAPGQIPPAVAA